jgi:hypothetical protein
MKPLALAGSAIAVIGAKRFERRMVLRLRASRSGTDIEEQDGALMMKRI